MNQENQLTEQNSEETEIDLLEIFYLLRAKLVWLILAFVIGGVIAGSITHFLITPKYTATAKMYMISASSEVCLICRISISEHPFPRTIPN